MLVNEANSPDFSVRLRRGERQQQVEVLVKRSLEVPSAVLRFGNGLSGKALGLVSVAGVYRFALPDTLAHPTLTLTDDRHQTILFTTTF